MKKPHHPHGDKLTKDLLDALGLYDQGVLSIALSVGVGKMSTVTIERHLDTMEVEQVTKALLAAEVELENAKVDSMELEKAIESIAHDVARTEAKGNP